MRLKRFQAQLLPLKIRLVSQPDVSEKALCANLPCFDLVIGTIIGVLAGIAIATFIGKRIT